MSCIKRSTGFSRLELLVVVIVICVLAGILLDRLVYYQELAEKAHMEYTISRVKSALRLRVAQLMVTGRGQDYGLLADDNPFDWLEEGRPPNYQGILTDSRTTDFSPGSWYFDPSNRILIYTVRRGRSFQPGPSGLKQVRWQIIYLRNLALEDEQSVHPTDSVAIQLIDDYKWF